MSFVSPVLSAGFTWLYGRPQLLHTAVVTSGTGSGISGALLEHVKALCGFRDSRLPSESVNCTGNDFNVGLGAGVP